MSHISSLTTELAALLIQNDFLRSEADERNIRAAREAERQAIADEIAAMRDAADAIVTEAWVQGGMAAAGGVAQCAGSLGQAGNSAPGPNASQVELGEFRKKNLQLEALAKGGAGLASIAGPAGELLGGVPKAHAETDAARARHAAEQAGSRAEEAAAHRDRVERHTEQVFDLVEGTLDTEHQGNFAILANF